MKLSIIFVIVIGLFLLFSEIAEFIVGAFIKFGVRCVHCVVFTSVLLYNIPYWTASWSYPVSSLLLNERNLGFVYIRKDLTSAECFFSASTCK